MLMAATSATSRIELVAREVTVLAAISALERSTWPVRAHDWVIRACCGTKFAPNRLARTG